MTLYKDYISPNHKDWNKVLNSVINNQTAFDEWISNEVMDPRWDYVGTETANNILNDILRNYKFNPQMANRYMVDNAYIKIVADGSDIIDITYDIYDLENDSYNVPTDIQNYYDNEMDKIADQVLREYNEELINTWNGTYDNYNFITDRVENYPVYFDENGNAIAYEIYSGDQFYI